MIKLQGARTGYNEEYCSFDMNHRLRTLDEQIEALQMKKKNLLFLERYHQMDISFEHIVNVQLYDSYVEVYQEADHYRTAEEIYLFRVETNTGTYMGGLIFSGNRDIEEASYHVVLPRCATEPLYLAMRYAILEMTNWQETTALFMDVV